MMKSCNVLSSMVLLALTLSRIPQPSHAQVWPSLNFFTNSEESEVTWKSMASREFDKFPGSAKCGGWHRNYSQLHRLIRKGSEQWYAKQQYEPGASENPEWRRFATFSCRQGSLRKCGGLGDVLLGIVSTFLVAVLQNRAFVVDYPLLSHAFEPNMIDWRLTDDVPQAATISVSSDRSPAAMSESMQEEVKGAVVEVDLLNTVPESLDKFFDPLHDAANLKIRWNRGVLTKLLLTDLDKIGGPTPGADHWTQVLHEIGLRLPTAFGCLLKYIMRPKLQIYRMAEAAFRGMDESGLVPGSSMCIHVRTPDELTWDRAGEGAGEGADRELAQWANEKVLSCAKKIEDFWFHVPPQDVRWVVLSNSKALKTTIKKERGDKVYVTETVPTHTALRRDVPGQILSFKTAAADWLVYTRCSLYLMTESGFSKTAALYGGHPFSIFLLSRKYYASKKNEWQDVCHPLSPATFKLLGVRWSGV